MNITIAGFENVNIKTGLDYSSALSLAKTVLVYSNKPVLLLLDTNSNEPTEIADRKEFVRSYLNRAPPGVDLKVIWFQPELETIFFEDASVAEHLMGRPLTEKELKLVRLHPKQVLQEAMTGKDFDLIAKLNSDDISRLNQLAIFQEIKSFLQPEKENIVKFL